MKKIIAIIVGVCVMFVYCIAEAEPRIGPYKASKLLRVRTVQQDLRAFYQSTTQYDVQVLNTVAKQQARITDEMLELMIQFIYERETKYDLPPDSEEAKQIEDIWDTSINNIKDQSEVIE